MKKITTLFLMFALFAIVSCAQQSNKKQTTDNESVVVQMDNQMFINKIFDYTKNKNDWKYKGDKPAIIDFYATWCGPCKMVAPIIKDLAEQYKGQVNVYKVDTDKQKELSMAMGIQSLPTILFIPMKGQPQAIVGAASKKVFEDAVKDVLLKDK